MSDIKVSFGGVPIVIQLGENTQAALDASSRAVAAAAAATALFTSTDRAGTIAQRGAIPIGQRTYEMEFHVNDIVPPRTFVWRKDAAGVGADDWVGLPTPSEQSNLGNATGVLKQENAPWVVGGLAGLDTALSNVDANSIQRDGNLQNQVDSLKGDIVGITSLTATPPAVAVGATVASVLLKRTVTGSVTKQYVEWDGGKYRAYYDPAATDLTVPPAIATPTSVLVIGSSLSIPGKWVEAAAAAAGLAIKNAALYASTSRKQALRVGAFSTSLTLASGTLPAAGTEGTVTLINGAAPTYANPDAILHANEGDADPAGHQISGMLGGRHVTIIHRPATAPNVYKIFQDAGGAALAIPDGSEFVPDWKADLATSEIWGDWGQNGYDVPEREFSNLDAILRLTRSPRIYLSGVLNDATQGTGTAGLAAVKAYNAQFKARYPQYYVEMRTALLAAGSSTGDDAADRSNEIIPRSQRTTGGVVDSLHPGTAGNTTWANTQIAARAGLGVPPALTSASVLSLTVTDAVSGNADTARVSLGTATSAQGSKADTALQPGAPATAISYAGSNVATALEVPTKFLRKLLPESSLASARWRIGGRVYGTLDAAVGFYFRKVRLPAAATVDDKVSMPLVDRLLTSPVASFLRRPAGETAGPSSTLRVKIGNRVYATIDAANGLFPRKLTLPLTSKFEDGSTVANRLVGPNAGDKIKGFGGEQGAGGSIRWRIGNRVYATLDRVSGFYPRKLTLPASAKVDDDLTATLVSRLVSAGTGSMLKKLGPETGGVVRFRWGNRLLGTYTKAGGVMWARQTLPADCKIADLPSINLVDRLGGSGRAASVNASYIAMAAVMANGKSQITTRRRSDSALIQITPASALGSYRNPVLTSDDRVLFDSDSDGRMMYAPAAGGAIWPVDPWDIIDCWGDSLTAGAGSVGTGAGQGSFPKQLKDLIGAVVSAVNNRGVGGQTSQEIEARHGGAPARITVTGNQIPASGPVTVTAYDIDLLRSSGVSGALTLTCTVAGVPGTLSGSNSGTVGQSTYTFTRTTAGAAVSCPPNTPVIPDLGTQSRPRVHLFTYGRNNGTNSAGTDAILAALAAGVGYQTAYLPRFLVGGTLAASGETLAPFNTQRDAIAAAYPGRFVDLNAVPTSEEMAIIGFVPDSYGAYSNGRTDAQDLAGNWIPSGMRSGATTGNGDFLHLNNFGYALWALRYYRAIVSKGWFPSLPAI